jgi:hypothetical protein
LLNLLLGGRAAREYERNECKGGDPFHE